MNYNIDFEHYYYEPEEINWEEYYEAMAEKADQEYESEMEDE